LNAAHLLDSRETREYMQYIRISTTADLSVSIYSVQKRTEKFLHTQYEEQTTIKPKFEKFYLDGANIKHLTFYLRTLMSALY
jgi:hypothetical protein